MLKSLFVNPSKVRVCYYDPSYTKLCVSEVAENGQLKYVSEYKRVSIADNFGHLSADDFSLNNILQTGSLNMLNPVFFKNSDVIGLSDSLDNLLKTLEYVES